MIPIIYSEEFAKHYQFTKVLSHFCKLKPKPSKGFKKQKWLRHFCFGSKILAISTDLGRISCL